MAPAQTISADDLPAELVSRPRAAVPPQASSHSDGDAAATTADYATGAAAGAVAGGESNGGGGFGGAGVGGGLAAGSLATEAGTAGSGYAGVTAADPGAGAHPTAPGAPLGVPASAGSTRVGGDAPAAPDWARLLAQEAARRLAQARDTPLPPAGEGLMNELTRRFEATLIRTALQHTGGRRVEASLRLGIGRNTLTRKIQELGIDDA
jgi:two-component system nitrogen regulation response regulator GlnG